MSFEVNAAARREALRFRQAPTGPDSVRLGKMLGALATNDSDGSDLLRRRVASTKPRFFGHLGHVVADTVRLTLDSRADRGRFGLLVLDDGEARHAHARDMRHWYGLEKCWEDTLSTDAVTVLERGEGTNNVLALEGMWEGRMRALGLDYGLMHHMMTGGGTASRQMVLESYRMNGFLKRGRHPEPRTDRLDRMRRSPSPILSTSGLEIGQLHVFNNVYGGEQYIEALETTAVNFNRVDSGLCQFAGSGAIAYATALEELPAGNYGTIGEVTPQTVGPRIGCPLLLTPRLAQELWVAYVDSLTQVNFM